MSEQLLTQVDWFEMVWELNLTMPEYCCSVMDYSDDQGNLSQRNAHKLISEHGLLADWLEDGWQETGLNGIRILQWLGY